MAVLSMAVFFGGPDWDPLRQDPRYQSLLNGIGLPV